LKIFSGITLFKPLRLINIKALYAILSVAGLLFLTTLVFSPFIPYSITLKIGDIAHTTIEAPRFIEFESIEDKQKTKQLRKKRTALVEKIYLPDENINKAIKSEIIGIFTNLKEFKNSKKNKQEYKIPEGINFLSKKQLASIARLDNMAFSSIEYLTIRNTEFFLTKGIETINTANIKHKIYKNLEILDLDKNYKEFIFDILINKLKPNLIYNEAATKTAIENERESIEHFKTVLKQGQQIILKHDLVTAKHIEILKALNIYGVKASLFKFAGLFLLIFLLFLLLERFIYYFYYNIVYTNKKYFILTYVIVLIIVVISLFTQKITLLPQFFNYYFLIPISLSTMLLCLLVTPHISLLCGTLISILVTIVYNLNFQIFIYLFFANCATLFAIYKKHTRSSLIVSGYIVGLFNMLMVITFGLFNEINDIFWFGGNMLLAFINGVVSSMLSLAILPYFESIFKITTRQTLLEISNLNHPLLKRLILTAPGTYQHSLMVANISESAAESIGANPLLARTGAYFHDIGKIKRPIFFAENQFSGENAHNTLSPRMSKLIIASHTKDGLELAVKYKLPPIIKDIITEHHGNSLVSFFYSQVLQTEEIKNTESIKEDFRYGGPKPSTKESGIIMLADSVEAAIRSIEKPTIAKIENLIEKIFQEKIEDKQLNDCPLSLREINTIKETFLTLFKGIYHNRLDYQEELENIIEQTRTKPKNGK
jgi:cyclic-di-AMP phosphodiesterase PgpH